MKLKSDILIAIVLGVIDPGIVADRFEHQSGQTIG
jgi:hypothetical protein